VTRVSAVVICRDEADRIAACLESVAWCDEVVVVDSGSTDGTVEIARKHASRVLVREWPGYVAQKNYALEQTSGDWVLCLDADERCTAQVRDEILALIAGTLAYDIYRVPRKSYMMGRWIRGSGWYPNFRQPQLFRKGAMRYTLEPVHEGYENLSGKPIGTLTNAIWQFPFRDLEEVIRTLAALPEPPPSVRRVPLWSHPVPAGILVALMGVFWAGRKMIGLV